MAAAPGTRVIDLTTAWARLQAFVNATWPSWANRVAAQRGRLGSGGHGGPRPV